MNFCHYISLCETTMQENSITKHWKPFASEPFNGFVRERARRSSQGPSALTERNYGWLAKHREGGLWSLAAKPISGRPPKVNAKMIKWLVDVLTQKNPQQMKFEFALWTREMIQKLLKDKYGVKLSLGSIGRLLAQLGFTCQKPLYRAIQKNESLVKEWLAKVFPGIKRRAQQEKADIYFGDAASIRSDHHAGKTWAPKGKTPVVQSTGARFSFSINFRHPAKGQMRFMVTEGGVNSTVFIEFLKRLLVGAKKKIFLIVDGDPRIPQR